MRIVLVLLLAGCFHLCGYTQQELQTAQDHFNAAEFHEAIDILDGVLDDAADEDSTFNAARILRGECNIELKNYRRANSDFKDVLHNQPKNHLAHYYLGISKGRNQDFMGSIKHLRMCVDINPNYVKAYTNGAISFGYLGDYFRAIDFLDRALELEPNNARTYYNRAYWKEQNNEYEEAIADYLEAIKIDPIYADAYNGLGNCYFKEGKKDEACTNWNKGHDLGSHKSDAIIKEYCNE